MTKDQFKELIETLKPLRKKYGFQGLVSALADIAGAEGVRTQKPASWCGVVDRLDEVFAYLQDETLQ